MLSRHHEGATGRGMDRSTSILKLIRCAVALRQGDVTGCLDLLLDVIGQMGASQAQLAELEAIAFQEADQPYIWDRPEPCRED